MNATEADDPVLRETSWPMPGATDHHGSDLEWVLRYGEPTRQDLLSAAAVIAAYDALIVDSSTEQQQHRLAALRRVYRQRQRNKR